MNTDHAQLALLGQAKHQAALNAFIEKISPDTGHDRDCEGFIIPTGCHDIRLHLWATSDKVEVRGRAHGAPILSTAPGRTNSSIMDRCGAVMADALSVMSTPAMDTVPAWVREATERELAQRAERLADMAGTRVMLDFNNAVAVVEAELIRRGAVYPEQVIPHLMEAGLSCQWVKDRPPGQRAYAGHSPDLRALQDAIYSAGAVPYLRMDPSGFGDEDAPASLYLGWEVVRSDSRPVINALHGFVLSPGPRTFDVLIGYLKSSRWEILGDGPVAAWCRQHVKK